LTRRHFALGLENWNQLSESTFVIVAGRTVAIGIDPFRVLRKEVFVQLAL